MWEVVSAVRSVRGSEPGCTGDDVLRAVAETSGVAMPVLRAALDYWGDYPDEIDAFVERARTEADQARTRWEREQELLGL